MNLLNLFTQYETLGILSIILFSFTAGFIDAVVGGGGLIQLPVLLIALPQTPIQTLFGTNKIAALAGTSISAIEYSKRVSFNYKLLLAVSASAGLASFLGAKTLNYIH
ncbi:MAG: sulfite exporter TauE/SafE family protein, partial [Bacteroidia bacterium]|nr:sulfite exporter TauE/SafE family protein [Bacteroidia bacterium]